MTCLTGVFFALMMGLPFYQDGRSWQSELSRLPCLTDFAIVNVDNNNGEFLFLMANNRRYMLDSCLHSRFSDQGPRGLKRTALL